MNYNEMTSAQCADWLAEKDGWKLHRLYKLWYRGSSEEDCEVLPKGTHPFQLTLDAAAGALREPWMLASLEISGFGHVVAGIRTRKHDHWKFIEGPDRMTAEYRAAVAARMEEER